MNIIQTAQMPRGSGAAYNDFMVRLTLLGAASASTGATLCIRARCQGINGLRGVNTENAVQRFITAFNEIESHFRTALGVDEHVEFVKLAREYLATRHLPLKHQDALLLFARLRNAVSHEPYRNGRPIADPRPDVVEQIEQLRDLYLKPPTALNILGQREVCSIAPGQPISAALEYVRLFDYSQLLVYDGDSYVGILTTNAIARWLAARLAATGGLAEAETVDHVLKFAEQYERARHVPRTITAAARSTSCPRVVKRAAPSRH